MCLYMHDPQEPHFSALKRIMRYVQGTLDYGLQLFLSSTTSLVANYNADWAGCPTTRRSTYGSVFFLAITCSHGLLSVNHCFLVPMQRQSIVVLPMLFAETCWLRNLLRKLHTHLSLATLVYCDNVSAVYLSFNPVQHQRTKHIKIDIHFVRDLVAAGQVRILHVPSLMRGIASSQKVLPLNGS
jgi:hypothetical protein